MKYKNIVTIGEAIVQFLREEKLEKSFLEHKLVEAWPRVLGNAVARYTGKIEINNGVLFVHITSSALRQELFLARFRLVKKLNEEVGAEVISDIRLLG